MDQNQGLENDLAIDNIEDQVQKKAFTNSVYVNTLYKVLQNYNQIITIVNNKLDSLSQLTIEDLKEIVQSTDEIQSMAEGQKNHRLFKLTDQVLNYVFSLNLGDSISKRRVKWVFPKNINNEISSLTNIDHVSYTNSLALAFVQQRMSSFEQGSYNSQEQIQALYDAVNIIAYYYTNNERKPFDQILCQQFSKEYLAYEFQPKYQKFQDETIYLLKQVEDYYAEE